MADVTDQYRPQLAEINELSEPHDLIADRVWTNGSVFGIQFWYTPFPTYSKYFCAGRAESAEQLFLETKENLLSLMESDAMNIFSTDLFEYMTGEMIGDASVTLTIKSVELQKVTSSRGEEQKPIVTFKERSKKWVLNKTNAKMLAERMGPETDDWVGRRVVLNAPMINAFGRSMRAVRVDHILPAKNGQRKPVKQVSDDKITEDMLPFDLDDEPAGAFAE